MIYKLLYRFIILTTLSLFLFPSLLQAQITVPGIQGLTFNETGSDYTIQITNNFTLHSISVSPISLWLRWKHAENTFNIYGTLRLKIDGDSIDVNLGNANTPGLIIINRQIQSVFFGVTANFTFKGIKFHPQNIIFEWAGNDEKYVLHGITSVEIHGNVISANLGDEIVPGIEISDGVFDQINITLAQQFSVDGISILPVILGVNWTGIGNKFKMIGTVLILFESDTIRTSLGHLGSPGIEVTNGYVDFINITLSADFNIKGLKVSPQNLTFFWEKDNFRYKIYGLAEVKPEGEEITVSLGDDGTPGIVVKNGIVDTINIEIIANFSLKGITFHPKNLAFHYSRSDSLYKLYGSSTIQIENDTLAVDLGNENIPGIKIKKGILEEIDIGITASFKLKGLNFQPVNLTFIYDRPNTKFVMFGNIILGIEEDTFSVSLGDSTQPGLEMKDGILEKVNVAFSDSFKLKGLTFQNIATGFQWDKNLKQFSLFGKVNLRFESNTVEADLGAPAYPGIKISNGQITNVNILINGSFHFSSITFKPSELYMSWSRNPSKYFMTGTLQLLFDNESLEVDLGTGDNPGIEIVNGKIDLIDIGLTGSFSIKGVLLHPSELTFYYSKRDSTFKILGSLLLELENDYLSADLGTDSLPGIEIKNGIIKEINIGINAVFSLKSILILPHDLNFHWNKSDDTLSMFGSIAVKVEADTFIAVLGTEQNPGIKIINGKITHINIGVTADFEFKKLAIKPNGLTLEWDGGSTGQQHIYKFYGNLFVEIDNQTLNASFGTSAEPGILINNGSLKNINIGITSDFKLGNIEVITKNLTLKYSNEKYSLTGLMEIKSLWSASIDLGSGSNAGIELDVSGPKDKFILESLIITIEHANMGAIDFKKIELAFKNNTISEADLKVSFPPGWDIEGKITFTGNPAKVNSVYLAWEAQNIESAIEIPGTGVVVMKMDGTVANLNDPANLYFHGDIGFAFGGPFTLDGKEVTMIYLQAGASVTHSEVKFTGDTYVGAYKTGDGKWHSILGYGSITIDLVWNKKYSLKGNFNVPTDPVIEAVLNAQINQHKNIDALLKVGFIVPHWVPIIKGKHFGSVDGAIRYINGASKSSYAAAWVDVNLRIKHIIVGVKYNFGTKELSTIGSGSVKDIEKQIHNDIGNAAGKASTSNSQIINSFLLKPKTPQLLYVSLNWVKIIDTVHITVLGPEGVMNLVNLHVEDVDSSNSIPVYTTTNNVTTITKDSTAEFLLIANSLITEDSLLDRASLVPGKYQVILSYNSDVSQIDSFDISIEKYHSDASGTIDVTEAGSSSFNVDLNYYSYYPDSCLISVYSTDTLAYNGRLIKHLSYGAVNDSGFGRSSFIYHPPDYTAGSKIYLYYVIDDGINAPFYSNFAGGFTYSPPITGNVTVIAPGNTAIPAILVYLDHSGNGYFDTKSTGELEPAFITDENGDFAFHALSPGTYNVNLVLPKGYVLDESSPNSLPSVINYSNSPKQLNFVIRKEN